MQIIFNADHRSYPAGTIADFADEAAAALCNTPIRGKQNAFVARPAERKDVEAAERAATSAADPGLRTVEFTTDYRAYNAGDQATFPQEEAKRLVDGKAAIYSSPRSAAEKPSPEPEEKKIVILLKDYGNLNAGDSASFPVSVCTQLVRDRTANWKPGDVEPNEKTTKATKSPKTAVVKKSPVRK